MEHTHDSHKYKAKRYCVCFVHFFLFVRITAACLAMRSAAVYLPFVKRCAISHCGHASTLWVNNTFSSTAASLYYARQSAGTWA